MKPRPSSFPAQHARQLAFPRAMGREPTASERALWEALRSSQLGVGFRRQAVVARCIVDFLAASRRLIVEVDGTHQASPQQSRADVRRDRPRTRRLSRPAVAGGARHRQPRRGSASRAVACLRSHRRSSNVTFDLLRELRSQKVL